MTLHPTTFEYLKPRDGQADVVNDESVSVVMNHLRKVTADYAAVIDRALDDGPDKTYILRGVEFRTLQRDNDLLSEAINGVMVASNHIAVHRSDRWPNWPNYPLDGLTRDQQCEHALRTLGAGRDYDMWCCWSAMMQIRDGLAIKE